MTFATFSITLPWPPSANHYWQILRRGPLAGRVHISTEGKAFAKEVAQLAIVAGVPRGLEDRIGLDILAHAPDRRARDLDNLLKPLLDAMKSGRGSKYIRAGIFVNDDQVDDIRIRRGFVSNGCGRVVVTVRCITAQELAMAA